MLSRYQYKENRTNITLSIKKLNKLTKMIKDIIVAIPESDRVTISETVDVINDELMGAELKKKVVKSGLKLLHMLREKYVGRDVDELILSYCNYVEEIVLK